MSSPLIKRRTYLKLAALLLLFLICIYLTISGFIASSIFHTVRKPLTTTPTQYGLQYEPVEFQSAGDNIALEGWFMHPPGTSGVGRDQTIVLLHGSNSNKGNYIMMEVARALVAHGYNVFSFDFRGNGKSGGDMSSLGEWETRDVAGALSYLKTRGVAEVGVIGYSMGAATALNAAPDHPEMRAIISDSAFARLSTVVDAEGKKTSMLAPLFNPGVALMSKVLFGIDFGENEPERAVSALRDRPILLIHSTGDDLIPVSEAYELQIAGSQDPNLELWVAKGNGHVSAFADNKSEYLQRILTFFDKSLAPKK